MVVSSILPLTTRSFRHYAPESNPDEYLNHALKLLVHSGSLPQTKHDIRHKTDFYAILTTLP